MSTTHATLAYTTASRVLVAMGSMERSVPVYVPTDSSTHAVAIVLVTQVEHVNVLDISQDQFVTLVFLGGVAMNVSYWKRARTQASQH